MVSDLMMTAQIPPFFADSLPLEKGTIGSLPATAVPFFLNDLFQDRDIVCYVAPHEEGMRTLAETLKRLSPTLTILTFPGWDCTPYDRISPQKSIVGERLETLFQLARWSEHPPKGEKLLVVATASSLLQRVPPRSVLKGHSFSFNVGTTLQRQAFLNFLNAQGYERVETVRERGEYAIRGSLIDLYPSSFTHPVRLDLFGDNIETIRLFDPLNQRSGDPVQRVQLRPSSEVILTEKAVSSFRTKYRDLASQGGTKTRLYESISENTRLQGCEHWLPFYYDHLETLAAYLPANIQVCLPHDLSESLDNRWSFILDHYEARQDSLKADPKTEDPYIPLLPEDLYISLKEVQGIFKAWKVLNLSPHTLPPSESVQNLEVKPAPKLNALKPGAPMEALEELSQDQDRRTVIACQSTGTQDRLAHMLKERDFKSVHSIDSLKDLGSLRPTSVALVTLPLQSGFETSSLIMLSEFDVLGAPLRQRSTKTPTSTDSHLFIGEISALSQGDLVVHIAHGIAKFQGLETLEISGKAHDCAQLAYDGGDKLFVPVENLDLITRYGSESATARLDKLGNTAWQMRKAQAKERLKVAAEELIKTAAHRTLQKAETFSPSPGFYDEFCARFPFEETPDQLSAIGDAISDLGRGEPTDRLICGDVGFGKTEVALRAAAIVAASGKQVAIVTPTTLLCRQHYRKFQERFAPFGFEVEQLSRLVPPGRAKKIHENLASGKVDILVGTHTLLSDKIKFKDLGLLVLDEEQHFGVRQKEKIKNIKGDVHVLTLTATPIPRTLQMALSGVRSMSLIKTPPVDRLAVKTFVTPFDPVTVKEALKREKNRGGQSFYVCPRVKDLGFVLQKLNALVPELSVITAHGQMSSKELEAAMIAFDKGEYDILLSTNIVESGIDIPRANTMIIHRSDLFGLSQLYQLRGRIGRSNKRAYAYLTLQEHGNPTPQALKRLEAMQTLDSLGAGFQLASHDMDIRGAGNLLGEEQSGHINEVGVELYQHLLEEAVSQARTGQDTPSQGTSEAIEEFWSPQLNLGLSVMIPEDYVSDLNVRLELYRRLSRTQTQTDVESIAAEIIDRFGPLPQVVSNLLEVIKVKQTARLAYVSRVDVGPKGTVIHFHKKQFPNPEAMISLIYDKKGVWKLRPDQSLIVLAPLPKGPEQLKAVQKILFVLAETAKPA
ncbi:MAG: transcription-repair coupling factor [bacterium]|nr:transcription-repair coupling factor [bacterium]